MDFVVCDNCKREVSKEKIKWFFDQKDKYECKGEQIKFFTIFSYKKVEKQKTRII